jgi:TolB-like protein
MGIKVNSRQLAAVMFTSIEKNDLKPEANDITTDSDSSSRLERSIYRDILLEKVTSNKGTVLKFFGNVAVSVFDSAIQAVECTLEIQTGLKEHNAIQGQEIPVRIGLHIGDIAFEDDDIYGDAVNLAARLQDLSVPGSVLFSEKVFDDIKNHPEFKTQSMGFFRLKNVKRAVEVFALANSPLTVPKLSQLREKAPSTIRNLAVLPFVNMSSDQDNEYFSDGMTEELIDSFSKVDGLHVTARRSSFAFKGKNQDIRTIASRLNVDAVLAGSVRKAGNRVRITARLVNAEDGYHIFSETYDRELEDIFAVQGEVAHDIRGKLKSRLSA